MSWPDAPSGGPRLYDAHSPNLPPVDYPERLPRPPSPALPMAYAFDTDFHEQLARKLDLLVFTQQLRRRLYGVNIAEDFPISHTPPEVKEQHLLAREAELRDLEAPTPEEEEVAWDGRHSKHAYAKMPLDTPPSDIPTPSPWRATGRAKTLAPLKITITPHTPPSSQEDSPSLSPDTISAPVYQHGVAPGNMWAGRKRSFAKVMESRSEERPCRRRRFIMPTRRAAITSG